MFKRKTKTQKYREKILKNQTTIETLKAENRIMAKLALGKDGKIKTEEDVHNESKEQIKNVKDILKKPKPVQEQSQEEVQQPVQEQQYYQPQPHAVQASERYQQPVQGQPLVLGVDIIFKSGQTLSFNVEESNLETILENVTVAIDNKCSIVLGANIINGDDISYVKYFNLQEE
jgi:hypothetical protein